MKQKTAMMDLIEWASTELRLDGYEHDVIIKKAKELLKKEKDQMESNFHIGIIISITGQKSTYNEIYKRNYLED